jgi:hypothetical protein
MTNETLNFYQQQQQLVPKSPLEKAKQLARKQQIDDYKYSINEQIPLSAPPLNFSHSYFQTSSSSSHFPLSPISTSTAGKMLVHSNQKNYNYYHPYNNSHCSSMPSSPSSISSGYSTSSSSSNLTSPDKIIGSLI